MERINFEDTTVTRQPYVTIDGTNYEVQDGTYSGGTDLDAYTFNKLQDNIEEALSNVGGNEIAISETEPTTETTKLWINSGEVSGAVSEITNSYSTSTGIGYSANYVNTKLPQIVYTTVTVNLTLNAGASGYVAITNPSVTGYTCIGCTFTRTDGDIVSVSSPILATNWRTRITNISSGSSTIKGTLYVYWATNVTAYS